MASWITAQLKAAEGLLEAVDKTVSRTVGTLGLAEGDSEQLTVEYGASRSASNLPLSSLGAGTYQQSYPSVPGGSSAYPLATTNPTAFASASGPTAHYGSAIAAAPWETRSTASTFTSGGPTGSGRALTVTGESSTSSGPPVGFTVKSDAPIPFGDPPSPVAPSAVPSSPEVSGSSFSRSGKQSKPSGEGEGEDAAVPLSKQVAQPSTAATALTRTAVTASHGNGLSVVKGVAGTSTAASIAPSGTSVPGIGLGAGAAPLPQLVVRGAAGAPAGAASLVGPALAAPGSGSGSGTSLGTIGVAATEMSAGSPQEEATPATSLSDLPSGSSQPAAATTAASPPSTSAPRSSLAGGNGAYMASSPNGGQTPVKGDAARASGSPPAPPVATGTPSAGQSASGQQQQQLASNSGGGAGGSSPAPAPVAALASATTAAASTLASATTTAVTHSLSFFNLAFEDPDLAADGGGGAGANTGGGAQQVQSLSRTCEQLRKRLEASRVENEQLEDMLARAEVRAQQEAALVSALREELAGLQQARATTESSLTAQLAVARSSLAEVSDKYEASQRMVLVLEGQLSALEESSRRLLEQHSDREGGMVDALRSELMAAEARLAAETKAHQATRAAAAARELDLEQQIGGSTAALAEVTRRLEEANRKCRGLEEEVVEAARGRNELSLQVSALQQQLEDAGIEVPQMGADAQGGEARGIAGRGGAAVAAAAAAAAELEALRNELLQHQRAAQLARQAAESSQAQATALAQEVEALRQSAEQHKDTTQLEAQLREVSDMLYLKQTQLERLAAEKAAQQLKTERELESVRQELAKLTRQTIQQGGIGRGGIEGVGGGGSPHDVIPMDALGEPYQRLARHNRVGRAVKAAANFLDSTASTTAFALRQYPLARLVVFMYALLIHLYVYLLIARMQRLATHYEAAAVAPTVT